MGEDQVTQFAHLRKVPAERWAGRVLPASAATWTAAEIMHLAAFPGALDLSIATALASAFAWGASGRWEKIPRRLPWWIAGTGAWLTAAAADGPLARWPWPHPWCLPLTLGWGIAAIAAYRRARYHPAVIEAQEWRQKRARWLSQSRDWDMGGSHLLAHEDTRLGEAYDVDVRGTGKRASQIAGSHVAEVIAERESLPLSRVRVTPHRLAGRVRVSIRRADPWADPIFHPVVASDPEIDLTGPYSITTAPLVGQDPETGRTLEVPLWDDAGGKNVFILGLKGAGKGVLLDNLSERVTKAPDALQIRVNLSVKAPQEVQRWGPACHLTALGTGQAARERAVRVLRVVNGIIEWRSRRYATGQYDPSPEDPLLVVIFDESDSAMAVPGVRKLAQDIATKGREYGVDLVRAGQRGTTDYGSAKIRSQDDVFCVGKVNRMGEVYHAAGSAGFSIPDMAAYGEGAAGVWAIAELGGGCRLGRTWILGESRAAQATAVARIARERAFAQPELHPDCAAFLGDTYAELLATDVFAEWARDSARGGGREFPAARPRVSPARAEPEPEASSPVTVTDSAIDYLDFDMDETSRARLAEIDRKLDGTRQILNEESARMREQAPTVPQDKIDAYFAERWRQVGEQAQIPAEAREPLIALLRKGTTIGEVAETFGITKWIARTWLEKLRNEKLAWIDGQGRGARFRLTEGSDGP